ncbi:MAG: MarR family transcriptional regulator [Candidatus Krumholzibacteriota bacterium]|nr:MarR family transcriptional regulator [Candidatus Krumholzibacteriota bacterium]
MNELDHTEGILVSLRRIIRAIAIHSRQLATKHHLTVPQLLVLREIQRESDVPMGRLAAMVNLSRPTLSSIVDRLVRRELVARIRDGHDRRIVRARLTGAGEEILAQAPPLLQEHFIDELSRCDDAGLSAIRSSLDRVVMMMDAGRLDAAPVLSMGHSIVAEGVEEKIGTDSRKDS